MDFQESETAPSARSGFDPPARAYPPIQAPSSFTLLSKNEHNKRDGTNLLHLHTHFNILSVT
jgi:hypothetical protein